MGRSRMAIPDQGEAPDLLGRFRAVYPHSKGSVFMARAPGRVNLIGEHTAYNEGFVLPVAVDREVRLLGQRRPAVAPPSSLTRWA